MNGNGRTLMTHEATVTTAAVEIKTLTVRGKQVTQAMFRQLLEEPLIGDDGNFAGLPWGVVNYHPDKKQCPRRKHLHVVWQKGDELRRALEVEPQAALSYLWSPDLAPIWLDLAIVAGWRGQPLRGYEEGDWYDYLSVRFTEDLPPCRIDLGSTQRRAMAGEAGWLLEIQERAEKHNYTRAQVQSWIVEDLRNQVARHQRERARWAELCDLPQLFIAV